MQEAQFFHYDIADVLERLDRRARSLNRSTNTMHIFLSDDSQKTIAQLDTLLHSAAEDVGEWVELPGKLSLDDYIERVVHLPEINTTQVLGLAYHHLGANELINPSIAYWAHGLLRKFEVFGRIFGRYTSAMRRTSERFDIILNYSLLSLVLLRHFDRTGRPEYLNTALKINDLLIATELRLQSEGEVLTAIVALRLGASQVEKFYACQGFRMPVDQ